MRVLAGDIGGTKTLLAICDVQDARVETLFEQRFASQDYAEFPILVDAFLGRIPPHLRASAEGACLAVAGPVAAGAADSAVKVTNLPWSLQAAAFADQIGVHHVEFINDFAAVAYGLAGLSAEQRCVLQAGRPEVRGPRIVVGAGTGLGLAQMMWCGQGYDVVSSEMGHSSFAPGNLRQLALAHALMVQCEHLALEDVLSGPGLARIYQYIVAREARQVDAVVGPADVVDRAVAGEALAREALDLFLEIYGSAAGDLALINKAAGGLYVAGGIAPRLQTFMIEGPFMGAFRSKGKMAALMATIPVTLVLEPRVGLIGAALRGAR